MAKKGGFRRYADNITQNINDMRTGLNNMASDSDRVNMAKFARVLGFTMLAAGILYLISTIQKLGLF